MCVCDVTFPVSKQSVTHKTTTHGQIIRDVRVTNHTILSVHEMNQLYVVFPQECNVCGFGQIILNFVMAVAICLLG